MLRLVDLSNNNRGPIDFGALRRSGVYGVWLKATEGLNFVDATYEARSSAARIVGLHVGGYHFARPQPGSAGAEAQRFVSVLRKIHRRDLRPVLDLEVNDVKLAPADLHLWARTFLLHVHDLTGVRGLTYSSPAFIRAQGWGRTFGTGAGLWLADYGPDDGNDHGAHVPLPWREVVAHQYTSKGNVHGVTGNVDLTHARRRRRILAHPVLGLP